jgi:hypothetical protein
MLLPVLRNPHLITGPSFERDFSQNLLRPFDFTFSIASTNEKSIEN